MLVLKSTHEQMKAEARANGAALHQIVGELIKGMEALGLRAEPKPGESTAGLILRYLREELSETDALRIELHTAQRERDSYRERLLRFTAPRERGPGGRFIKVGASFPVPGSAADVSPPLHRTIS